MGCLIFDTALEYNRHRKIILERYGYVQVQKRPCRISPQLTILENYYRNYSTMSDKQQKASTYWKENLRYLFILLTIWFAVSYGAGILFKDVLDTIQIGGFKLGFWFAQQGSIYVFVID